MAAGVASTLSPACLQDDSSLHGFKHSALIMELNHPKACTIQDPFPVWPLVRARPAGGCGLHAGIGQLQLISA